MIFMLNGKLDKYLFSGGYCQHTDGMGTFKALKMKNIVLFIISFLLSSCSTLVSNKYFVGLSVDDINDCNSKNLVYSSHYIDYHVPEAGSISEPQIDFSIKHDTLKKYNISLFADIVFCKDDSGYWDSSKKDSICLRKIIISSAKYPPMIIDNGELFNMKKCKIPKRILLALRDDFFFRMKYTKFNFPRSKNKAYTYGHNYRLY